MTLYLWFTRCIPAFSICAIAVLLFFAFVVSPHGTGYDRGATTAQLVLSVYTVLLNISSISFPARVCWSMVRMNRKMRQATPAMPSMRTQDPFPGKKTEGDLAFANPMFVILLPAYKEEMGTLETTLRVLASHPQARHSYHVYLAMEEKEQGCECKAAMLVGMFQQSFYRIGYTVHPVGIPGEAQGKSSNESWAARQASVDYPEASLREKIIMTTMDADTHLSSRYFQEIARMHATHPETKDTTIYVPPIVFDRNLHRVPLCVRTVDMMWAGAGLSSLYQGSRVCIPTSVYSLPMSLVDRVGGWDTGPGAIGEDMHMYLKCFFALSGNLTCQIVYAAASQCNVSSDVGGFTGYFDGLKARYNQGLRHMWGSLDSGFSVRETITVANQYQRIKLSDSIPQVTVPTTLHKALQRLSLGALAYCSVSWNALYAITITSDNSSPKPAFPRHHAHAHVPTPPAVSMNTVTAPPMHYRNFLTLFHRILEAHFLPVHLCLVLTTSSVYKYYLPTSAIPRVLHYALNFSDQCRLIAFLLMMAYFALYSTYHRLCLSLRQEEMRLAGLLEQMAEHDGFSEEAFQVAGILEACVFPIGGFVFGALPALHAMLSHVFTERLTYVVSLKPQTAGKARKDSGMEVESVESRVVTVLDGDFSARST